MSDAFSSAVEGVVRAEETEHLLQGHSCANCRHQMLLPWAGVKCVLKLQERRRRLPESGICVRWTALSKVQP